MKKALLVSCVLLAIACSSSARSTTGPNQGGQGGMAAGDEGSAASNGGTAVTGGQAGTAAGSSGTSGTSGGSGGTAGAMQPVDGGSDAMTPHDAMTDASTPRMPLAAAVCPAGPFGDPLPPAGGQRTATIVPGDQSSFVFLEGPVWLAEQGVLLFSDMDFGAADMTNGPPARIRRLTPPSTYDVFQENGNSNGLALDLEGDVLACTHDMQTLSRYDRMTAARTTLSTLDYDDEHFNSPNDLTVRSDGTIYFTDPDWQRAGRDSVGSTNVYRVTSAGNVELVTDALDKPNGIALSPDEGVLYIGSSGSDIVAFTVQEDGSTSGGGVFVSAGGGTDGLTVDCAGNLYATGGNQVQVWNAIGDKLGDIAVPQGTSNVAFGGADRKTLYITAQDGLYSIQLLVPGLPY